MSEATWTESEIKARLDEYEELFYETLVATDSFYENGYDDLYDNLQWFEIDCLQVVEPFQYILDGIEDPEEKTDLWWIRA